MDERYWELAQRAADRAAEYGLSNIRPEWIYAQFAHETGNYTSELCRDYNNLGGLTQVESNDTPQPDGSCYYMQFESPERYADYFGAYLRYYISDGIDGAQTLDEYVRALKRGGYFGDTVENYLAGTYAVLREEFPGIE